MTSIKALREMLAKATPGPWGVWRFELRDGKHYRITYSARGLNKGADFTVAELEGTEGNDANNAALIVAAINALPALLDIATEAERLIEPYQNLDPAFFRETDKGAALAPLQAALSRLSDGDK